MCFISDYHQQIISKVRHCLLKQAIPMSKAGFLSSNYKAKTNQTQLFMCIPPHDVLLTKPESIKHKMELQYLSVIKSISCELNRRNIRGQGFWKSKNCDKVKNQNKTNRCIIRYDKKSAPISIYTEVTKQTTKEDGNYLLYKEAKTILTQKKRMMHYH